MNTEAKTGSCLCKKVTASFKPSQSNFGACHCSMCQKWTGGPYFAIQCGPEVAFQGQSLDAISVYNSSDWAERGFCKHCGSNIFYRLKGNSSYFLSLGFADDLSSMEFDHQVFIDEKPECYSFANKTKNMTGAEVFAAFQQGQS